MGIKYTCDGVGCDVAVASSARRRERPGKWTTVRVTSEHDPQGVSYQLCEDCTKRFEKVVAVIDRYTPVSER